MKKKTMSYVMTGALSISILSSVPTSPVQAQAPQLLKESAAQMTARTGARSFSDVLKEQAAALGVDIEGDDLETAAAKVRQAKLFKQALILNIDPNGKTDRALRKEIAQTYKERVQQAAADLGIHTNGLRSKEIISAIGSADPAAAELFYSIQE